MDDTCYNIKYPKYIKFKDDTQHLENICKVQSMGRHETIKDQLKSLWASLDITVLPKDLKEEDFRLYDKEWNECDPKELLEFYYDPSSDK